MNKATTKELQKLKLNVKNIHSVLINANKKQEKLSSSITRFEKKEEQKKKFEAKERRLESPFSSSLDNIKKSVKPQMQEWEKNFFSYIRDLQQYCCYDVYKTTKDVYKVAALKSQKGYQKSYEKFFHRSDDDLKQLIKKESLMKLNKIDIAVHKKLKNVHVNKIEQIHFSPYSADGSVTGAWKINDKKVFSFETILAGGYNVQCLHIRNIYKFK